MPIPSSLSTKNNSRLLLRETLATLVGLYKRRRPLLLRICYIALIYLGFNSGGTRSKRSRKDKKEQRKSIIEKSSTPKKRVLNPITLLKNKYNNIRNSDLVLFLSTLDLKDKKTHPIIFFLISQVVLLIIRAFLTLKVASLDGLIVSSLVSRKFKLFFKNVAFWMIIGIPASLNNSLLTFSEKNLSKHIRMNFTDILLNQYLPDSGNSTIYQLINKTKKLQDEQDEEETSNNNNKTKRELQLHITPADKMQLQPSKEKEKEDEEEISIEDPNQRLTTIVELFSKSMATLTPQLLKPTLDILLCANQLSKTEGNSAEGVVSLGLITHLSSFVLKMFTPNFTMLSLKNNELENKFHMYHSKIVQDSEEIALAKGHRREIEMLDTHYFELEAFKRMELRRMAIYHFAFSFIVKYVWGACGLLLCAVPIFSTAYASDFKLTDRMVNKLSADFITNRRLLLTGSSALGKIIDSKKNIQNLFGYSTKLWEFYKVLNDINDNDGTSTIMTSNDQRQSFSNQHKNIGDVADLSFHFPINEIDKPLITGPNVEYGEEVSFYNIPLVTPSKNVLVESLNFTIKPGQNLLIIGPNGCGKSSLFRILGGLWPVLNPGKLVIPPSKSDLFYLPQRAYLMIGTLKEQIIYPDSIEDFEKKLAKARQNNDKVVKDDNYLIGLLNIVQLGNLVDDCEGIIQERVEELQFGKHRHKHQQKKKGSADGTDMTNEFLSMEEIPESPLDLSRKWPDLLSVGEQQRLALARLYYHQPKFAVLDECTSSISSELEQECYRFAIQEMKITVISVCHRTTLWKFHDHILKFDGNGNTRFGPFNPEQRLLWHDELLRIEDELKGVDSLRTRLQDLQKFKQRSLEETGTKRKKLMYLDD